MIQPRPLGPRKTVQLMVILTILAWATQTLFHQWGFGGIIFPSAPAAQSLSESPAPAAATETPGDDAARFHPARNANSGRRHAAD